MASKLDYSRSKKNTHDAIVKASTLTEQLIDRFEDEVMDMLWAAKPPSVTGPEEVEKFDRATADLKDKVSTKLLDLLKLAVRAWELVSDCEEWFVRARINLTGLLDAEAARRDYWNIFRPEEFLHTWHHMVNERISEFLYMLDGFCEFEQNKLWHVRHDLSLEQLQVLRAILHTEMWEAIHCWERSSRTDKEISANRPQAKQSIRRFRAPNCPKCGAKLKVDGTKETHRHLKCTNTTCDYERKAPKAPASTNVHGRVHELMDNGSAQG